MPSKELIVRTLLNNDWVQGTALAEACGKSRTAIWNNIALLKNRGYDIESHPKDGYKLVSVPTCLYPELVKYQLKTSVIGKNIIHYMSTGSTNDDARELCRKGAHMGTVVIAEEQTGGRGRCNRSWSTTPGTSIAMSIILKPTGKKPRDAYQFTMMSAVGLFDALQSVVDVDKISIKWPNDVLINGKKVAGILTELNGEMDMIRNLIVGIGVNVNQDRADFADALPDATSVMLETGTVIDRLQLLRDILNCIDTRYSQLMNNGFEEVFSVWKQHCCSIGKQIRYSSGSIDGVGVVENIAPDGGLQIHDEEGNPKTLYSGDICFV